LTGDVEGSQFDTGTTPIRLVRVGNVVQILFSSSLESKLPYNELVEKYRRAEDGLKGG
jgi:hypothetical protein